MYRIRVDLCHIQYVINTARLKKTPCMDDLLFTFHTF